VNSIGIPLGVEERQPGAVALTQEIDAFVAERSPGRIDVLEDLGDRVSRRVHARSSETGRSHSGGLGDTQPGALAEDVAVALSQRPGDFRTLELCGAVDAPVADENDVT
jgi:hypothetical protein